MKVDEIHSLLTTIYKIKLE